MKKKVLLLAFLLVFSTMFAGCSGGDDNNSDSGKGSSSVDLSFLKSEEDMFTSRDYEVGYDEDSIQITLNGTTAACDSEDVTIDGSKITITADGTYVVTGTLNDGMIIVDTDDTAKPQIVLDNASVTSKTSAALYIVEADKVFVTTTEGSNNSLVNGGTFTAIDDSNIDGAIFSKQDIVFNGNGKLTVSSPAGHGIVGKDDVKITSGTYTINSASHGIDANDSVRIANGDITIDAGKDGIHAENADDESLGYVYVLGGNLNIDAEGDGISAGSSIQLEGGTFDIVTGGGSVNSQKETSDSYGGFMGGKPGGGGMGRGDKNQQSNATATIAEDETDSDSEDGTSIKGLKSTLTIYIDDANITIDSADDTIHSNSSMVINNGTYDLTSGDDGFHADETLVINAGNIIINESYEGIEGLDIEIYGGEIKLVASDDGINAAGGSDQSGMGGNRGNESFGGAGGGSTGGSIKICGGSIYMQASGDGVDSNGTLEITGGYVEVCGPTNGDTAVLDYQTTGVINGGTFAGTGAYMMAQTLSSDEQGVLAVNVGSQSANTKIEIVDSDGNVVVSFTPDLSYQIMIFSSPDIEKGETYTINVGSISGEVEAS